MTAWIVIITIGAASYALRASMLVAVAGRPLPERLRVPLGLVGPAAMGALIATFVFTNSGATTLPPVGELAAVVAGALAVRRSGNVLHAFAVGLPVLWLFELLAGA